MHKYKSIALILTGFTIVCFALFLQSTKFAYAEQTEAQAEIVMEAQTQSVLHEKKSNLQLPMASTTKIMTALLIIEDCNLNEEITVPKQAQGVEGSSIYLKEGEKISVKDLLYGLMLRSGNDSAVALAIHHSGTVNEFVACMNKKAKQLGATHTRFANPSGLPDDNHYTTAFDLCKITCYAMQNATFCEVVSCKNYNGKYRNFSNKNKFLSLYQGANGVKTGYTLKAGRCLVTAAKREGMQLVCVVLNCRPSYETSASLLSDCFNRYQKIIINQDKIFTCGKVYAKMKSENSFIVNKGITISYKIESYPNNCIKFGDEVGKLRIYGQNNLIFEEKLYSIMNSK